MLCLLLLGFWLSWRTRQRGVITGFASTFGDGIWKHEHIGGLWKLPLVKLQGSVKYKSWVTKGLRLLLSLTSVSLSYSCVPGNNFEANPFILGIIKSTGGLEKSNTVKPERLLLYSCFCCVVKYHSISCPFFQGQVLCTSWPDRAHPCCLDLCGWFWSCSRVNTLPP